MDENQTQNSNLLAILDDLPAEVDQLDFQPYIDTLAEVIRSRNTRTPLTIGVFGSWGSGKTTLMKLVRKGLPGNYRVAWFDAWKYQDEMDLWRALLLTVLDELQESLPKGEDGQQKPEDVKTLERLRTSLYRSFEVEEVGGLEIDWGKLAGEVGAGVLQIGLSFIPGGSTLAKILEQLKNMTGEASAEEIMEAIHRERAQILIEQVLFLKDFQDEFREMVKTYVVDKGNRLVVFVDDLDRCLPEKAVEVLEAIKLFLDVDGCVFVLGLDDKVIARGVEVKYRQLGLGDDSAGETRKQRLVEGERYLEKIIQLPFDLPPIDQDKLEGFITGLVDGWAETECPRVFAAGLGGNPRQVKRAVNTHLLLTRLADRRDWAIQSVQLAKIVAIQNALPRLYKFLREGNHHFLKRLEDYFLKDPQAGRGSGAFNDERLEPSGSLESAQSKGSDLPQELTPYLRMQGIAAVGKVLSLHPDQPEHNFSALPLETLRAYFTLTRRAEAPDLGAEEAIPAPKVPLEPRMVAVPAGAFRMGTSQEKGNELLREGYSEQWLKYEQPQHRVTLSAYQIGATPVTNRQYQAFIRESDQAPPRHWDGDQFPPEKGEHPVVYVSWEDAQAYCRWLSAETEKTYRLPTEAEWEKAARGTDGFIYPWGNAWDTGKCNSSESGLDDTSAVGAYSPDGDSPYGCADMAGNVWEWCADWFGEDEYRSREDGVSNPLGPENGDIRVLRGGSFSSASEPVRCAVRGWTDPDLRDRYDGFRVCSSSPS